MGRKVVGLLAQLEDKFTIGDGCWEWTGCRGPRGYGKIRVGGRAGRTRAAHQVVYELFVGPIPEGLQLDHLCKNPPCVRPDHLEPVTGYVNIMRGDTFQAKNAAKTHCPQGHEYTDANTYLYADGRRACRVCRANYVREWKRRKLQPLDPKQRKSWQ